MTGSRQSNRVELNMSTKPFLLAFLAIFTVLAGIAGAQNPAAAAKPSPSPKAEAWQLTGNSGINAASQFVGTTDNRPLIIKTNGAERMRVDSNGNVGIGTANPGAALHVASGDVLMVGGGYNFAPSGETVADLAFFRGGTAADGVFMMKRYAPYHTILQINSPPDSLKSYEATLALVRGDEPNLESIDLYNNGYPSETQYGIRMRKHGTGQFQDFVFDYDDGTVKMEVLRLTPDLNVGIGTSDPQSSLQIGGYIQLDLTAGAPPSSDCDGPSHYGRMVVDAGAQSLYICVAPIGESTGGTWIQK